jgi:hypothetical protein
MGDDGKKRHSKDGERRKTRTSEGMSVALACSVFI